MTHPAPDVLIIGGGIAGLTCARVLQDNNISFLLLEADERIGGRIKTDRQNGYLLDRGFQVLQTAYPAAGELLDYHGLKLKAFAPGTVIRIKKRFHTVADPVRRPTDLLGTMTAPIGTFGDRLRLVKLVRRVNTLSLDQLFREPEMTTSEFLRRKGFSADMIQRFFIPFFGGTCLDPEIQASSRVFCYILRMFASGEAALPRDGMEQIPIQLAAKLNKETTLMNCRVDKIEQDRATLADGTAINAKAIVLATEGPETRRLLELPPEGRSIGQTCLYFGCDKAAWHSPYLILNGNPDGPINNIAIPSMVSRSYAPPGKSLVSVVVLGTHDETRLKDDVLRQLKEWYGDEVLHWQHLTTYTIFHALPEQLPPTPDPLKADPMFENGVFVCGEHGSLPAIQWSLYSGQRAAKAVINYLS